MLRIIMRAASDTMIGPHAVLTYHPRVPDNRNLSLYDVFILSYAIFI